MSKPTSLLQTNIHNALLPQNLATLVLGSILVAFGFILSGLPNLKYFGIADFTNLSLLAPAVISGLLIAFGFVLAFSQQYLSFALMSTLQEYSSVAVAGILLAIGQLLIGFGNSLVTAQPLAGGIVIIAGWVLVVVSTVLAGNTGFAIAKLSPPASK